jgi:hypothetical protein
MKEKKEKTITEQFDAGTKGKSTYEKIKEGRTAYSKLEKIERLLDDQEKRIKSLEKKLGLR